MAKKTVVRQVIYFGDEEWVDKIINKSFPLGKKIFRTDDDGQVSYIEIRQLEPLTGIVMEKENTTYCCLHFLCTGKHSEDCKTLSGVRYGKQESRSVS
jgi:hypothetical protein